MTTGQDHPPRRLTIAAFAGRLGVPPRRISYRLYKAGLIFAETGEWPVDVIPRPDQDVPAGSAPTWMEDREDVDDYVTDRAVPDVDVSGWLTTRDMAAGLGVTSGTVISSLHASRRAKDASVYGLARSRTRQPSVKIPEPDLDRDPVSGRKRLFWRPGRADVAAMFAAAADAARAPVGRLDDVVWLRSQYALPPAGLGRSVLSITTELGVARPTVVRRLRAIPGVVVRGRTDAVGAPSRTASGVSAGQAALEERRAAARAAQVAASRTVLASGARMSPRERLILEGRVAHPELTTRELAEALGVPRGSLAVLAKVLRRAEGGR